MAPVLFFFLMSASTTPEAYALHTPYNTWGVSVEDLTGNGILDIIAICSDERSYPLDKAVSVFLASGGGAYPATPTFSMRLTPDTGAVFFAEVDGSAPRELVAATGEGARIYRFTGEMFEHLKTVTFPSLLPTGAKQPRFVKDAAMDLTGDGREEWMIPVASGYEIRNADGEIAQVECDVVSDVRSGGAITTRHKHPAYMPFRGSGRVGKDLAFLSDDVAEFAYGEQWSNHKRFEIPLQLGEKWETVTKMADINGDGLPDFIVTQTEGTVNLKGLTQVFIATAPMSYPETATAAFEVKDSFASPILEDVNGNGQLDLLLINIPLGVKFFVNYFLFKKVSVRVDVHLFDGETYPERPDYSTSLTIEAPDGNEQATYALGDFNGDGIIDAAIGADANKLTIHFGSENRLFTSRPSLTLELPALGVARTYDLKNDGSDDIVIFHPFGEHRKRIEVVTF